MIVNRTSRPKRRAGRPARRKTSRVPNPPVNSAKFERALERLCLPHDEVVLANVLDEHIRRVLWAAHGEVSLAAQLLGLHRRSLQRMIQRGKKKPLR
jgi:ActR/RegA family two-component response regulator